MNQFNFDDLFISLPYFMLNFCIINFGNFNILEIVNYNYDFSYFDFFLLLTLCVYSQRLIASYILYAIFEYFQ